jgi:hypothetical protein
MSKLIEHAIHEVRREQRDVDVQVGVVLLVEVSLPAEREGDTDHEQRCRDPAQPTAPA